MKFAEKPKISDSSPRVFAFENLVLPALSLVALATTFLTSVSAAAFATKIAVFLAVVFFYLSFCAAFYFLRKKNAQTPVFEQETAGPETIFGAETEKHLLALEEASRFFGASLKPADMFRLAASRVGEMLPFAAAALFRVEEDGRTLKSIGASGENARELSGLQINSLKGLAGKTLLSRHIQTDENLLLERQAMPAAVLKNLHSAIAAPLFRNGDRIFAVLILYGDLEKSFDAETPVLLEAIAERVAPLFVSSMAFEQSLSSALTDVLTNLPNERAFYLILENQMAESQRCREQRPLTILAVDAKDFAGLNRKFGHATGDQILFFAADLIKQQLRKMDFLARTTSDEFLIVLPTASESVAEEIVERLEKAFRENPFVIEERERIYLELNFGAATYLKDGDTPQQLLDNARMQKQAAKSVEGSKILRFPKEPVH